VVVLKRIALAVLLLAVTCSAGAWAAASSALWLPKIHAEGGFGLPQQEEFKYGWKAGLGGGAGIETNVTKNLSIGFDFDYNHHGLNGERLIDDIRARIPEGMTVSETIVSGGSISIFTAMPTIRLDLTTSSSITPYLKAGFGFGRVTMAKANWSLVLADTSRRVLAYNATPLEYEDALATSIGVGVRQQPRGSKVGFTLEARWVRVSTMDGSTQMIPVRASFAIGF
jgi:opacity protein-like surface antigen